MKKAYMLAFFAVIAVGRVHGASITVTQPSGGEVTMTCPVQITWTASNVTSNVRILLRRPGGALVATIAGNLAASPGLYNWTVAAPAAAGESYRIHVRATDGSAEGTSAVFTVKDSAPLPPPPPPVMLQLEAPNGGETFVLHHDCTISWKSITPAAVGNVHLELLNSGGSLLGLIKDSLPATGSWTWKAGKFGGGTAPAGQYRVRVRSKADASIHDESDADFTLKSFSVLPFKAKRLIQQGETVPGVYQNYPCHDTFPGNISTPIPISVLQQGWQLLETSCGGANHTAEVGVYWFPYMTIQVAAIKRSRIIFYLSKYAGQGANLKSAKLKMKRIHSVHEDANSNCGCNENLWVLEAPMTSCVIPNIGQRIDVDLGATEFSKDITDIVKKWLDGTVVNNGLLLLAGELPCAGGRRCSSCYEASLLLTMK